MLKSSANSRPLTYPSAVVQNSTARRMSVTPMTTVPMLSTRRFSHPVPGAQARPPAGHGGAVLLVLRAELAGERRLLVELHERHDTRGHERGVPQQNGLGQQGRLPHDERPVRPGTSDCARSGTA